MEESVREAIPMLPASLVTVFLQAVEQAGERLAELVGRDIAFRGSEIAYTRVEDLPLCYQEGPETRVTAAYLAFSGDLEGHVMLSMPPEAADFLSRALLMYDDDLDDPSMRFLADSAIGEVANVAASAFLTAVADAAKLTVLPTPPAVVHDMWGALLQSIVVEVAQEQSYALYLDAHLIVEGDPLSGTMLLLPSASSCSRLASILGS